MLRRLLARHHDHAGDFRIRTGESEIDRFNQVVTVLKIAAGGIAAISLFVGAIGILTIMWISVHERTNEIGVLRALGVSTGTVQLLFLLESVLLAGAGGAAGIGVGLTAVGLGRTLVPGLPLSTPPVAVAAALVMCLVVGVVSGVAPARRAAALDPVDALRAE